MFFVICLIKPCVICRNNCFCFYLFTYYSNHAALHNRRKRPRKKLLWWNVTWWRSPVEVFSVVTTQSRMFCLRNILCRGDFVVLLCELRGFFAVIDARVIFFKRSWLKCNILGFLHWRWKLNLMEIHRRDSVLNDISRLINISKFTSQLWQKLC